MYFVYKSNIESCGSSKQLKAHQGQTTTPPGDSQATSSSTSQGQTPISVPHTQTTKTIASLSSPNQGQIPISIPHTHTTKTTVSLSYPSQEQNRHSSLFLTLSTKTIVSSLSSVVDEQSYIFHTLKLTQTAISILHTLSRKTTVSLFFLDQRQTPISVPHTWSTVLRMKNIFHTPKIWPRHPSPFLTHGLQKQLHPASPVLWMQNHVYFTHWKNWPQILIS